MTKGIVLLLCVLGFAVFANAALAAPVTIGETSSSAVCGEGWVFNHDRGLRGSGG